MQPLRGSGSGLDTAVVELGDTFRLVPGLSAASIAAAQCAAALRVIARLGGSAEPNHILNRGESHGVQASGAAT